VRANILSLYTYIFYLRTSLVNALVECVHSFHFLVLLDDICAIYVQVRLALEEAG
jgi:hypothetical protein